MPDSGAGGARRNFGATGEGVPREGKGAAGSRGAKATAGKGEAGSRGVLVRSGDGPFSAVRTLLKLRTIEQMAKCGPLPAIRTMQSYVSLILDQKMPEMGHAYLTERTYRVKYISVCKFADAVALPS